LILVCNWSLSNDWEKNYNRSKQLYVKFTETVVQKCCNCGAKQFQENTFKGNAIPNKEDLKALNEPNFTQDTSESIEQEPK